MNDGICTGITAIDTLLPVARGQRQLIVGDRGTGKTSIFAMCIVASTSTSCLGGNDSLGCRRLQFVYVGIGLPLSKLVMLISSLIGGGGGDARGLWNVLIVSSHSSSTAQLSFSLPLMALTISERLRDRGSDVLVCLDSLTSHAKCFRQLSLLLGNLPARDAYPSSIFIVHANLLERSAKLRCTFGGGSISVMPVAETLLGNYADYIVTNLISITDGQFILDSQLFREGQLPAIHLTLSVSRIGSNAQCNLVGGTARDIKELLASVQQQPQLLSAMAQAHLSPSTLVGTVVLAATVLAGSWLCREEVLHVLCADLMYCGYLVSLGCTRYSAVVPRLLSEVVIAGEHFV
ncbi:MAG: hypothetical protein OEM61_11845, partial [Desulfobacteraceae bacterium]|nr:hypothetical protein [Desulfobacteraceae bacterium]